MTSAKQIKKAIDKTTKREKVLRDRRNETEASRYIERKTEAGGASLKKWIRKHAREMAVKAKSPRGLERNEAESKLAIREEKANFASL